MTRVAKRIGMRPPLQALRGVPARSGRAAAIGLGLGIALGLVAFAPARWLAQALPAPGQLALTDARGTLWSGSARLWITGGADSSDRRALPQRVHWRLALAWTQAELQLRADCCTPQALRVALRLKDGGPVLELADSQSSWPAELLAGLGTPWNTLQLSGQLALQTQGVQLRLSGAEPRASGQATLDLHNLGSALSTLKPMGSYRLALTLAPAQSVQLQTLRGDLLLSGQGQFSGRGLRFRGDAEAAPGREEALGNILNIIGKREGSRTLISLG